MATEIGRNFNELKKSIAAVEKQIKSTKPELRELDKALRINPNDVELTQQKFAILATQLDANKQKAELLEENIKHLTNEFNNGNVAVERYEKQLASLERQKRMTTIQTKSLDGAIRQKNVSTKVANMSLGQTLRTTRQLSMAMRTLKRTSRFLGVAGVFGGLVGGITSLFRRNNNNSNEPSTPQSYQMPPPERPMFAPNREVNSMTLDQWNQKMSVRQEVYSALEAFNRDNPRGGSGFELVPASPSGLYEVVRAEELKRFNEQ